MLFLAELQLAGDGHSCGGRGMMAFARFAWDAMPGAVRLLASHARPYVRAPLPAAEAMHVRKAMYGARV